MQNLYHQQIMDHYHFPRHKGALSQQGCVSSACSNPSCGDQVTMVVCLQEGIIAAARFSGVGCILSLAAADILLDAVIGKAIEQAQSLTAQDIQKIVGIPVGPTRIKCLLLPYDALKLALQKGSSDA